MRFVLIFTLTPLFFSAQISTPYAANQTPTYAEVIEAYSALAKEFPNAELTNEQSGHPRPIYSFSVSNGEDGDRPCILIVNGIHPGESCGIDASLELIDGLLTTSNRLLDEVDIVIIPIYNVGGALNRSCCSRANQVGPEEHGFRGNEMNLDLNRDFIKMDSENAKVFTRIFHRWDPDIMVDTHTTNGADYQHTMTLIHNHLDLISQPLADYLDTSILPELYQRMESHYPMSPYVDKLGETPESGIKSFPDWPRYSNGYAGLFNTICFTTEAHMLKPYEDRVRATSHFLSELIGICAEKGGLELSSVREESFLADRNQKAWSYNFALDSSRVETFSFKGYRSSKEKSKVTGLDRLRYHRDRPFEQEVPLYRHMRALDEIQAPEYYVIPMAWKSVIERLKWNGIEMRQLERDSTMQVQAYYIEDYKSPEQPYEGHFLHSQVKTRLESMSIQFLKGDYLIATDQRNKRFLMNTLEPTARDSYFAWNFFDPILQQKEWFSPYVFEETAEDLFDSDPTLEKEFRQKQESEPEFSSNMWAQLIWIYRRSPYYEKSHMRYPVYRID